MGLVAALAACRFLRFAALFSLWGAAGFVAVLVPAPLARTLRVRFARPACVVALVALGATLALLPLDAARIGSGWWDGFDGATLSAVLFETSVGEAWRAEAATAALVTIVTLLCARRGVGPVAVVAGLALATSALTGHAVMHDGPEGAIQRANDILHLLAAGAWLGALLPLVAILRGLGGPERATEARIALRRYSLAGHGAVAIVILTGGLNSVLVLGTLPLEPSSPYRALLLAKIGVVAIMVLIALANRYLGVPLLRRRHKGAMAAITLGSVAEIALGAVALALVSLLALFEPL